MRASLRPSLPSAAHSEHGACLSHSVGCCCCGTTWRRQCRGGGGGCSCSCWPPWCFGATWALSGVSAAALWEAAGISVPGSGKGAFCCGDGNFLAVLKVGSSRAALRPGNCGRAGRAGRARGAREEFVRDPAGRGSACVRESESSTHSGRSERRERNASACASPKGPGLFGEGRTLA